MVQQGDTVWKESSDSFERQTGRQKRESLTGEGDGSHPVHDQGPGSKEGQLVRLGTTSNAVQDGRRTANSGIIRPQRETCTSHNVCPRPSVTDVSKKRILWKPGAFRAMWKRKPKVRDGEQRDRMAVAQRSLRVTSRPAKDFAMDGRDPVVWCGDKRRPWISPTGLFRAPHPTAPVPHANPQGSTEQTWNRQSPPSSAFAFQLLRPRLLWRFISFSSSHYTKALWQSGYLADGI